MAPKRRTESQGNDHATTDAADGSIDSENWEQSRLYYPQQRAVAPKQPDGSANTHATIAEQGETLDGTGDRGGLDAPQYYDTRFDGSKRVVVAAHAETSRNASETANNMSSVGPAGTSEEQDQLQGLQDPTSAAIHAASVVNTAAVLAKLADGGNGGNQQDYPVLTAEETRSLVRLQEKRELARVRQARLRARRKAGIPAASKGGPKTDLGPWSHPPAAVPPPDQNEQQPESQGASSQRPIDVDLSSGASNGTIVQPEDSLDQLAMAGPSTALVGGSSPAQRRRASDASPTPGSSEDAAGLTTDALLQRRERNRLYQARRRAKKKVVESGPQTSQRDLSGGFPELLDDNKRSTGVTPTTGAAVAEAVNHGVLARSQTQPQAQLRGESKLAPHPHSEVQAQAQAAARLLQKRELARLRQARLRARRKSEGGRLTDGKAT